MTFHKDALEVSVCHHDLPLDRAFYLRAPSLPHHSLLGPNVPFFPLPEVEAERFKVEGEGGEGEGGEKEEGNKVSSSPRNFGTSGSDPPPPPPPPPLIHFTSSLSPLTV